MVILAPSSVHTDLVDSQKQVARRTRAIEPGEDEDSVFWNFSVRVCLDARHIPFFSYDLS